MKQNSARCLLSVFVAVTLLGCTVNRRAAQTVIKANGLTEAEKHQLLNIPLSGVVESSTVSFNEDVRNFCDVNWILRLHDGRNVRITRMGDLSGMVVIKTPAQARAFFRLNSSSLGNKLSLEDQMGWEIQRDGKLFSLDISMPRSLPGLQYADPSVWSVEGAWYSRRLIVVPETLQNSAYVIEIFERATADGRYSVLKRTRLSDVHGQAFSIFSL